MREIPLQLPVQALTLVNLVTGNKIEFDNENYILSNKITDTLAVQHNTSKTIKQIGEYITSSNVNSRDINLTGYIIGKSELDLKQKKRELLNLTNPLQEVQVIVDNKYQVTGKCQSPVKWATTHENNNDKFVKFTIDILVPTTLWTDLEPTVVSLSPYVDTFIMPGHMSEADPMSFGHKTDDLLTNIYNECNVDVPLKITITALNTVTDPEIIRVNDDTIFKLNCTMQPGDVIVINTKFGSKKVTKNGINILGSVDLLNSTWIMLKPGLNTFTFSCGKKDEKSGLNISFMYYNNYWGVV